MRPRCKKHGSPMRGAADPFGNQTLFVCEACAHQRRADKLLKDAESARGREDSQAYMRLSDRARNALADVEKTSGRWFECKVDGEGQDLSEKQVDLARAAGSEVIVETEIV